MELSLEALGLSKDEITNRIIDRAVEQLLTGVVSNEDGDPAYIPSAFAKSLEKQIRARIDTAIDTIAGKHVLPNVATYVENLCLQETNQWGEKKGKAVTFVEYLVARAENYLTEEVNYDGKTKGQDTYSWRKEGTRVAHLVNKHLQYSIETAMKQALATANSAIVGGIEGAVKIKLQEVLTSLKVDIKTR